MGTGHRRPNTEFHHSNTPLLHYSFPDGRTRPGRITMRWIRGTVLVVALAAAGRVSAQSLYGPGGLFLLPTASLPEKGQLTPAVLVLPQHSPTDGKTRTW